MAKLITINGKPYLAGMVWLTHNAAEEINKKDVIEKTKDIPNSDWYVIRKYPVQIGICSAASDKIPSGTRSLAAHVADTNQEPWMGIFQIDEQADLYWFVAIKEQYKIMPEGDVIGSYVEVSRAKREQQGKTNWKYIESDMSALLLLLKDAERKGTSSDKVKSITTNISSTNLVMVTAFLILLAVAGSGYLWWSERQAAAAAIEAQNQKRLSQQAARTAEDNSIAKALKPLHDLPLPDDFLRQCREVFYSVPISSAGWQNAGMICTPDAVVVRWNRAEGATVEALPVIPLTNASPAVADPHGESASQSIVLRFQSHDMPKLMPGQTARDALQSWSQRTGFKLMLGKSLPLMLTAPRSQNSTLTNVPGFDLVANKPAPQPSPYTHAMFDVDMPIAPFGLQFEVPGLFIQKIEMTNTGYKVGGVIYGKQ